MLKKISKACFGVSLIVAASALYFAGLPDDVSADESNSTFQVNVKEVLTVSVTTPTTPASGNTGDFVRNKVSLAVTSNNNQGFVAGMRAGDASATLKNTRDSGKTISTLGATTTRANFPVNKWGYSLEDTDAGKSDSNYLTMVGSGSANPITLFNSASGTTKDVYFGAKIDSASMSGTYAGTVVFTVISGKTSFPVTPTPTPVPDDDPSDTPVYHPTSGDPSSDSGETGTTTYTTQVASGNVVTTTTQVTEGDTRSQYTPPQGEVEKTYGSYENNIADNSAIATALVTTASVAAASGIIFFIVAKRRKDDDEDDEQQYS